VQEKWECKNEKTEGLLYSQMLESPKNGFSKIRI